MNEHQIEEMLTYFRERNLYGAFCTFLEAKGVEPGKGWTSIKQALVRELDSRPGFVADLEEFAKEGVLASQKRAYFFEAEGIGPEHLAGPLPEGVETTFLRGKAPPRPSGFVAGQFASHKRGKTSIYTFLTHRTKAATEPVTKEMLKDEVPKHIRNAEVVAKFRTKLRCYDHLLVHGKRCALLVDEPRGIEGNSVEADVKQYEKAIRQVTRLVDSAPLFVDLFPAIGALYEDKAEGIVNYLKFMSNDMAQVAGSYRAASSLDYRLHPFQRGGAAKAEVKPFQIAVRWPHEPDQPYVTLEGKKGMVLRTGPERAPLTFMAFPLFTTWRAYQCAVEKVLASAVQ